MLLPANIGDTYAVTIQPFFQQEVQVVEYNRRAVLAADYTSITGCGSYQSKFESKCCHWTRRQADKEVEL